MLSTGNPKQELAEKPETWAIPHRVLMQKLGHGWPGSSVDVARDFVSRWSALLNCDIEVRETGDSFIAFRSDLGAIRFSGMEEARCLLVSGRPDEAVETATSFWHEANSPRKAVVVVAANRDVEAAIRAALPTARLAIFGPDTAVALMEDESPIEHLKRAIRAQVALRRLIPFDTEHPIEGPMFCGRTRMLNRLLEEEDVNFAVAGPGRIGKTSLLRRFRYTSLRSGDRSAASRYYIDLMPCRQTNADGLAQFIALKIGGGSKVSRLTCDRLEPFLTFQRAHHGRPVDLLLDETDEYLNLETFQFLGNAARKGLCRLVLAGRGELLRTVLSKDSRLHNRMELLRLDPLSEPEAAALLAGPLEDLGFTFSRKLEVLAQVLGLTGKLPQYVQFYGRRICELMIDGVFKTIDSAVIHWIRDEFETVQMFSGPIFEVKAPKTRFAALALLGTGHRALTLPQIQGILHHQGLLATVDEVWELANELVIQNTLAWNQGKFQIANESLPYYAHTHEFFGSAMRELRKQISPGLSH